MNPQDTPQMSSEEIPRHSVEACDSRLEYLDDGPEEGLLELVRAGLAAQEAERNKLIAEAALRGGQEPR